MNRHLPYCTTSRICEYPLLHYTCLTPVIYYVISDILHNVLTIARHYFLLWSMSSDYVMPRICEYNMYFHLLCKGENMPVHNNVIRRRLI